MKSNDNYEIVGCDANVAMVDSMIASLFKDLSHTRDHYISFDVTQLPSDFSPYLAPFSFKAAVESEMRAELALSVSNTLPPTAALKPLSPGMMWLSQRCIG